MPKGWSLTENRAMERDVVELRAPLLMQYRIEYLLYKHRKSKNNKPVKHKALVMPLGNLVVSQFVELSVAIGEEHKVEYLDLYMHFRKVCLDGTDHPDIDLPTFEQRMLDRFYQNKHLCAAKVKSGKSLSVEDKERTLQYLTTDVRKEGQYWIGLGIKKSDVTIEQPDGFMEFDAEDDESAYEYLCGRPEFNLDDERPIAGRNYLRFSRPKFWLRK